MWFDAIRSAFAVIRSLELLLPMSLSESCESPEAKPTYTARLILLQCNVNPRYRVLRQGVDAALQRFPFILHRILRRQSNPNIRLA
jgi:hypothetical protein